MSDTRSTGSSAGSEQDSPQDEPHHWWRLIAIWVVLSAVLDPLFYIYAGPHIPPGTMTNTAQGAQFDFNVLFVIALPEGETSHQAPPNVVLPSPLITPGLTSETNV